VNMEPIYNPKPLCRNSAIKSIGCVNWKRWQL